MKPRILYIEDEQDQRRAVVADLAAVGCEVVDVATGAEGLAALVERDFDAVFCDLNMPGMSGLEVLERATAARPDVPFVIVTGHGSIERGVDAIRRGAHNFICKPLTRDQLALDVQQAVEQRRVQQRLRRSESLLDMLLETVPDIIYSLDPRGNFLSISPSGERVLGYRVDQMLGRSVFELVHPDDRDRVREGMVQSIQRGENEIRTVAFRMITAAGEARDFEIKRRLIYDEDGRVIRNDGIARDVTDSVRAAAELQAVLDTASNAVILVDPSGLITAANRTVSELFGLQGPVVGLRLEQVLSQVEGCFERPERFRQLMGRLERAADPRPDEEWDLHEIYERALHVTRPAHRWVAPFSVPVQARQGHELARAWIFSDVTRFREADEQLHKLVAATPVPSIITRVSDGTILFANEPLAQLVRMPVDELVGRSSMEFYADPGDRDRVLAALRQRGRIQDHEVLFQRPDGTRFWTILALVLTEVGGEPVVLGGVSDIDERKRIEQELRWERNFVSAVLETAGALVVVLDREGRIVRFNTACQQTTGYSFDEVRGRPFWELLLLPTEAEAVKEVFRRLQAGDYPNTNENHWVTKEGGKRYITWSNTALTDAAGQVEYIVATGIDITEKQATEEKLRLYREIFMITSDGITIIDPHGKIVERNPAHRRISGYDDDEVLGRPATMLLGDVDEATVGRALREQGSFRGEISAIAKDGRRVVVDLSVYSIVDAAGALICYAGMGREITERKRVEEAIAARLRYEEALAACSQILLAAGDQDDPLAGVLQNLLEATRAGRVYIFHNVETADRGLCCMPTHEVRAPGVPSRLGAPELACVPYSQGAGRWSEDLARGLPICGEVCDFTAGGGERPDAPRTSILAVPIRVGEQWYGFIGFEDVDRERREWSDEDVRTLRTAAEMIGVYFQRRQAEEALRVSEERFRRLVENANDVIYSMTLDGRFSYISPRFAEQTGYAVDDYLGRTADFIHPDDWEEGLGWLRDEALQGIGQQGFEYRFRHRDGSWRWAVSNASVLRDPDGNVQEIVGVAHDITEAKLAQQEVERANRELKEKQAQLVQSEKMASLGMLVAGIAHEINTPIGAVNSVHNTLVRSTEKLKAILEKAVPELYERDRKLKLVLKAVDDSNQVIQSGTERVMTIVRRLKSFARLDEAELKKVDIHEGIEDTLTIIHHELKHKVEVVRDYGEVPPLACYPSQLNQVFLNLFINAKQAIADRGTIRIRTRTQGGQALIDVADDGVGMSRQTIKRIFDPGYTTKGVGVGTGLGLSICYQIIQDHRGEIRVESEEGVGTTFTVVLPLNLDELLNVSL